MMKFDYKYKTNLIKLFDFIPEPIFLVGPNFSRSENFQDSDYLESMANEWTPETSFRSEILRKHKDGYPRPGLGIDYECKS